jgi:hypothetical protein
VNGEELVRLLAKHDYQSSLESMMTGKTWDAVSDYGRAAFIADAQEFRSMIVEFVAAWLADRYGNRSAEDLARLWREDMT